MKKKTKTIKCWIEIFGEVRNPPMILILWKKPSKKERETAEDYGFKFYKAEIKYQVSP